MDSVAFARIPPNEKESSASALRSNNTQPSCIVHNHKKHILVPAFESSH